MTGPDAQPALPWYRHFHVWLLIAFPAVSVVVGLAMLLVAIRSDDGLVADDYYRQGMEINRSLERDRTAQAAGLTAKLDPDSKPGVIRVTLDAHAGFPIPARLRVSFLHPTRAGKDRVIELPAVDPMSYEGSLPELDRARWYVLLEADDWRLVETLDRR